MATPAAPIPSAPVQFAIQSAASPSESPSRRWLLWLAGGLAILIFGVSIGIFSAKFLNQPATKSQISSYEDCLAAKGSIVQESYPATCVTTFGQRFVQPLTDEEKQSLQPPDLYREPDGSAATVSWKTYTDEEFGFTFRYNPSGKIEELSAPDARIISYFGPYTPTQQILYYKISLQKSTFVEPSKPSTNISVAGTTAKRWDDIDTPEGNSLLIILNTGKGFLKLEYFIRGGGWDTQLNQILSTFHFLK